MPFYLTFGLRIPAALVGYVSSIGFVEIREAGTLEFRNDPSENIPKAPPSGTLLPTSLRLFEALGISRGVAKPAAIDINPQSQCGLLSTFPPEIRNTTFREVLVSARPIQKAAKLIGDEREKLREKKDNGLLKSTDPRPADDIDSALLRTCYRAYQEGRDILAVKPVLRERRNSTLTSYGPHEDGRLSLIRNLSLNLDCQFMSSSSRSLTEIHWEDFFAKSRSGCSRNIHFSILEELMVDFSGLELRSEEDNWLNAFVRKLETFGKLTKLTVRGVSHPKTLETMCEKLVKDDGEFHTIVG